MRYMTLYRPGFETDAPPSLEEMEKMGRLIEEMAREGIMIATGGLEPSRTGMRIRQDGDKLRVTDGPFTEAKELVGGFAVIEADSREEAIELTRRFLEVVGQGECEMRPVQMSIFAPAESGA